MPFVVAGDPAASYLIYKLTGVEPERWNGERCQRVMPADVNGMGDVPLIEIDPAAVEVVRRWIQEGASFE